MKRSIALILCLGSSLHARADDPAAVAELRKAGLSVSSARPGGFNVGIRSAADLTEGVWKNLETLDVRGFSVFGDGSTFGDEQLARVCKMKSLEVFFANGPPITDAGLAPLAQLPKLREFGVHHAETKNAMRGRGFAILKDAKNFAALEFGGAMIDDKGLEGIVQLVQLEKIGLYHTRITSAGIPLLPKLTGLESLALGAHFSPDFVAADLRHLGAMKHLKELVLERMVLQYDDGLAHLSDMKQLKKLSLREVGLAEPDLARIKAELPRTQVEFRPASAENIARWHEALARKKK